MVRFQFHPFLERNEFCNISKIKLYLDQNGDLTTDLIIKGCSVFPGEIPSGGILGTFERQRLIIVQEVLSQLKLFNKVGENLVSFFCFPKPQEPFRGFSTFPFCQPPTIQYVHNWGTTHKGLRFVFSLYAKSIGEDNSVDSPRIQVWTEIR